MVLSGDLAAPAGIIVNAGQTSLSGGAVLRLRGAITNTEADYVARGSAGSIAGVGSVAHGWTLETLVAMQANSVVGGAAPCAVRPSVIAKCGGAGIPSAQRGFVQQYGAGGGRKF